MLNADDLPAPGAPHSATVLLALLMSARAPMTHNSNWVCITVPLDFIEAAEAALALDMAGLPCAR